MDVESLSDLGTARRRALLDRETDLAAVRADAEQIIDRVRTEGDVAVREFNSEFDGVSVGNLDVSDLAERAIGDVDPDIVAAIETAASNIRRFHERQRRSDWDMEVDGGTLGRRFHPLERVGAYVPGGTAAYPSSALMTVIPAKVAGVEQVAVTTPPGDPINPITLAALEIVGVDEIYRIGGAQAIGALAYGTETVPAVDKIVGPGNQWVTAGKATVHGDVEIDMLAGPSEILVIADETARPEWVASDLVAQAEHGPTSVCVAISPDRAFMEALSAEVADRAPETARAEIVEQALSSNASALLTTRSMSEAIAFASEFAPEHLSVQTAEPATIADRISTAGSVFLGHSTPVALGDYASGTNHVLPTHGLTKRTSGLSVDDFVRSSTVQSFTPAGLDRLAETVRTLAHAEGLDAHAESITARQDDG